MKNIHHINKPGLLIQMLQFPASTVQVISRQNVGTIAIPAYRPILTGVALLGIFALTRQFEFIIIGAGALMCPLMRGLAAVCDRQEGIHHDPYSRGKSKVAEFLPANTSEQFIDIWLEPLACVLFAIGVLCVGLWIWAAWMAFVAIAIHITAKADYQSDDAPQACQYSSEDRLAAFDELYRTGQITEQEYDSKREQILSEL